MKNLFKDKMDLGDAVMSMKGFNGKSEGTLKD